MKNQSIFIMMMALVMFAFFEANAQVDTANRTHQSQMPPNQLNPASPQNQTNPNGTIQTVPANPNQTNPQSVPGQHTYPSTPSQTDPKLQQQDPLNPANPNNQTPMKKYPDSSRISNLHYNTITPADQKISDEQIKTIVGKDKPSGKDGNGHQLYTSPDGRKYYVNDQGQKIYVK